jgi:chromate transport protein ChrA
MWNRWMRIARMGFMLGATVFGGVNVAYPLIRERARELELTPEDVDSLFALALLLPGPSFLNLWGAVSARVAGPVGAVIGQVSLLLPSFLLVLLLPLAAKVPWVAQRTDGALLGASWAVVGLLLGTGVEMLRRQKDWSERVLTAAGLVALLAGGHPLWLLLLFLALGGMVGWYRSRRKEETA